MKRSKILLAGSCSILWLLLQGCSTSELIEPDMDPDWRGDVATDYLATVHIMEERERVIIGNDNDIHLLDLNSGRVVSSMEESFWESITPTVEYAGITFDSAISEAYTLVPREEAGNVLLYDYRFEDESVTALSVDTGEEQWQNIHHDYSLEMYSDLMNAAAEALAGMLGGEAQTESPAEERQRQIEFINSIVHEHPETEDFFLKTFGGLLLMDADEGIAKWQIEAFLGPGLAAVEKLPGGDYVVMSTGRSLGDMEFSMAYHLARISPDGESRWISEHSGTRVDGLHVTEEHAVVDGAPTEVFDLDTGEKLWENDVIKGVRHHHMVVTDDRLFIAGDLESRTVQAGQAACVWEHDLDTGEIVWQTEETDTRLFQLELVDDRLLVRGEGELFGGNGGLAAFDRDSGEQLWTTPEMASHGSFWDLLFNPEVEVGPVVTRPVLYDGVVYVADPMRIYALDFETGEVLFERNHEEQGSVSALGVVAYNGRVAVVGAEAVVAYDSRSGSLEYAADIERSTGYAVYDEHVVINNGSTRIGAFDLETGEPGPMVRLERTAGNRFGDMSRSFHLSQDGRQVYVLDEDGSILRFSLL